MHVVYKVFYIKELSFVSASGVTFGADSLVLENSPQWTLYLFIRQTFSY